MSTKEDINEELEKPDTNTLRVNLPVLLVDEKEPKPVITNTSILCTRAE